MDDTNLLLQLFLLEEEEQEEEQIQLIFLNRTEEGYFKLLINHLNFDQFYFLLAIIQSELTKPGTNVLRFPITILKILYVH